MRKVLGLTFALLLTLAISAAASEVKGTVKAIDRADNSIVLDDGTRLTVSEGQISSLTAGDQVRAMYQTEGGKNVVSDLGFRGVGSESRATTNWGPTYGPEMDSIQSGD